MPGHTELNSRSGVIITLLCSMYRVNLPVSYDVSFLFFLNDTATPEIYTLSLHDALPIYRYRGRRSGWHRIRLRVQRLWGECDPGRVSPHIAAPRRHGCRTAVGQGSQQARHHGVDRSEEHTSELQSPDHLVCRLLLEKKKQ